MLLKTLKAYFHKKDEIVPVSQQATFLNRLSELLKEGYIFHEAVTMLLPFHVKNVNVVQMKVMDIQKRGQSIVEVFRMLGFPNRLLLPLHLSSQHGHLAETTEILSINAKFMEQARKRLKTLLMYPLFLFVVIFLLFTVFRIYFLPNMESLLSKNQPQPQSSLALTNTLLNLPNIFLIFLIFMIVFIVFLWFIFRNKSVEFKIALLKKIPIINNWYRLLLTRVFSREMGVLLESGLSLQESFGALINQKENKLLQHIVCEMKEKVIYGSSFSEGAVLVDSFTVDFHQFIVHGENNGYLGKELTLYSDFMNKQMEARLSRYLSIIQPVMFLILAVFIIGAYLAILLPVYEMINII
ncbi:competence type IV pilus assembly protein ComGB [Psychrobacillus sp. AK 1817]|uniref:competence type IV pilus assembly protein ComGB n=1 Tax=Psychrobacillus sp. AK 1817 TaxID=2303505 RepID=UPI001245D84A|nr:competence type IV pilus assembly protein ComGB [Psychrobacillus sp. AK 1817]